MIRYIIAILLVFTSALHPVFTQIPSSCEEAIQVCTLDTMILRSHSIVTENNDILEELCGIEDINTLYQGANWLKYEFDGAGIFTFLLYPDGMNTDLDFHVFSSKGDCSTLTCIRCMLSGSYDDPRCMGITGLRAKSIDTYEFAGCDYFDDNYLAPIHVQAGAILYLAIYNHSNNEKNYRIIHGGTATLNCDAKKPEARAEVYPNPSAGKLKIAGHHLKSTRVGIEVYDDEGKNHLRQSLYLDEIIDISELPSGVYIINIHDDGQLISSQRIIHIR